MAVKERFDVSQLDRLNQLSVDDKGYLRMGENRLVMITYRGCVPAALEIFKTETIWHIKVEETKAYIFDKEDLKKEACLVVDISKPYEIPKEAHIWTSLRDSKDYDKKYFKMKYSELSYQELRALKNHHDGKIAK